MIRAGAKGSKVFSERVNQYLHEREMFGAEEIPFSVLTERELDVLHELAQGLSNTDCLGVEYFRADSKSTDPQSTAQLECPLTRGSHHSVPAQMRGTIKIARWIYHRAEIL